MSRRHLIKLATAAVAVAILLLAARNCQNELADVTVAFERGDGPAIKSLSAELYRRGEEAPVARFTREIEPDAAATVASWTLQIDPGSYQLALLIEPVDGPPVEDRRAIEARARATIAIDLSRSLPRQER